MKAIPPTQIRRAHKTISARFENKIKVGSYLASIK